MRSPRAEFFTTGLVEVVEVPIAGNVPLDVDTPEDYQAVLRARFTEVTA